jgi:hypothetical protein
MDLSDVDKYGFPFCWFVDKYDELNELNNKNANLLCEITKKSIDEFYKCNYLDYSGFIDEISKLLDISNEDKIKYLEQEKKCLLCNKNYPHSFEIFTDFIDYNSKENINSKICYDCAYSKYNCMNCNQEQYIEPYEKIYIYTNCENKNGYVNLCEKCINIKLPFISLLYKNFKFEIDFNE